MMPQWSKTITKYKIEFPISYSLSLFAIVGSSRSKSTIISTAIEFYDYTINNVYGYSFYNNTEWEMNIFILCIGI